ncbi:MAG: helical backbone metal receptor [Bacteroidota bacterium]
MLVRDQLHRELHLSGTPTRIVSLVPSQTELLVDLGLRDRLVGVTKFCVHPKDLRSEVTVVGGTKSVHYDRIKEQQPDLIVCNKEENSLEMVTALEEIAPVYVSDIATVHDSFEMIWQLGEILGVRDVAKRMIEDTTVALEEFEAFMAGKPQKKVAYLIWKNPYMAAGSDTFINSLLALNNFESIVDEKRYPEVSIEQLASADLVLLSSEPFPFKEKDIKEIKQDLHCDVRLVDGEYFSWYGSRLRQAFAYFKTLHD